MRFTDTYDAYCKADHLLEQLANAHILTANEHRDAANNLLAYAQMLAIRDDRSSYLAKAQTLAALAVAHSAIAGIPASARLAAEPAEQIPPSRVRFNPDGQQAGLRR